jgi:hypothetical protein
VCLYSFHSYIALNAHARYYIVICGLSGSTIFFHITSKTGKKLLNIKCVLIFSITFVSNISHSEKNIMRYDHTCTYACTKSTRKALYIALKVHKFYDNRNKYLYPLTMDFCSLYACSNTCSLFNPLKTKRICFI